MPYKMYQGIKKSVIKKYNQQKEDNKAVRFKYYL